MSFRIPYIRQEYKEQIEIINNGYVLLFSEDILSIERLMVTNFKGLIFLDYRIIQEFYFGIVLSSLNLNLLFGIPHSLPFMGCVSI